ncbi:MAG: hypothetical protein QW144_01855 [Candidatus Micrarchaeaceae archaeon]
MGGNKGIIDILELLKRKDLASKEIHTKNDYEAVFKDVLLEFKGNGVEAYYELFTFPLRNKKGYLPDFTTNLTVNGKLVVIEEHASLDTEFLEKIDEFRKSYKIYMIVGTKSPIEVHMNNECNVTNYMDEYWYVPNNIKTSIDAKTSKEILRLYISGLIKKAEILDTNTFAKVLKECIRSGSEALIMAKN